jgi:nitrous oxide reductase accessory protein NosL
MTRYALIAAVAALAACSQVQEDRAVSAAQTANMTLESACDMAVMLAPIAGPYAPFITAGCSTAEGIAKLASDPSSVAWVEGLIADVRKL